MLLFHGTDNFSAENIIKSGVNFEICDQYTDNGRGFYLTNNKAFAEVRASVMTLPPQKPVVVEIFFDENRAKEELNILRFDETTDDWRFFVAFNRTGLEHYSIMSSYFPQKINNLNHSYDIVIDYPADSGISSITDIIDELLDKAKGEPEPLKVYRNKLIRQIKRINEGNNDLLYKQYSFHTMRSLKFLHINGIFYAPSTQWIGDDTMIGAMVSMQKNNSVLKETAIKSIINILVTQYNVSRDMAWMLIQDSKIDQIFDRSAEIASHTSNKTWAKRAYEYFNVNE